MSTIAENIAGIRAQMAEAAKKAGRDPSEILLCAATKMNDAERVKEAVAAGVDCCGENRVQEIQAKRPLGAYTGKPLHFIGHLQTNKVKYLVGVVDLIESVDRLELLECIEKQAEKVGVVQNILFEVNIGAEESKGDTLRRETYQKLKEAGEAGHLNFTGNIEAKEAMLGECDVIVADGYSGNIMLKSIEGTGKLLSIKLKDMLMHSTGTKLAALLLKGQLGDFKKMLDANEVGGTALLGISKPVVKAHGSASEVGICNAVRQAMEVARSGIIDDIAQNIDKMRIEQKAE